MKRHFTVVVCAAALAPILLVVAFGIWHRSVHPFGRSHACDLILYDALHSYASNHNGRFPSKYTSPEACLTDLYPVYSNAQILAGKAIDKNETAEALRSGEVLYLSRFRSEHW